MMKVKTQTWDSNEVCCWFSSQQKWRKPCLQLMAVQCVRKWLWCSAPSFHLSVVHQPHIPEGIGSYSPSGKGCICRSHVLLSPPRVGSASSDNPKAWETSHCRRRVLCWWRPRAAIASGQVTFVSAEFTWEEEFSYSEDASVDNFVLCYIGGV